MKTIGIDLNKYDFNKMELLRTEEGEFVDLAEAVPDIVERMTKYAPEIVAIKKTRYVYKIDDKNTLVRTVKTVKSRVLQRVLDRRKNWKPFGKATNTNNGTKSIAEPVYMDIANEKGEFDDDNATSSEVKKILEKLPTKILGKKSGKSGFSLSSYKPNLTLLNGSASTVGIESSSSFSTTDRYIPESIKNMMNKNVGLENFSLVIKNIPTFMERRDVDQELRKLFGGFGSIRKINILHDSYDSTKLRGIAFIEYAYATEATEALNSTKRFSIGPSILLKEKANKKK